MAEITYAILAFLPVIGWYFYTQMKQYRFKKFAHVPIQYPQSLALGHLKLMAEGFKKVGDSRKHVGALILLSLSS